MKLNRAQAIFATVFLVLLIDQVVKIYVKTNLSYATGFEMLGLDWARIHFVENEGMAFGITFGNKCIGVSNSDGSCTGLMLSPSTAKLILSSFRIVMIGFLIYLIREMHQSKEKIGLLVSFSLILAGAIGNIIDSAVYGLIFSESQYHGEVARLFPAEGGYGTFLQGKVVDMLYFPMLDTTLPGWLPIWGGQRFEFFRPVFNIADSAIFIGVALILIFYRKSLFQSTPTKGVGAQS